MQLLAVSSLLLGLASAVTSTDQSQVAIINQITLNSTHCPSPSNSSAECRMPCQSAPHIFRGLEDYSITNANIMAAVVSNMAFESGNFTYKRNLNPDNHGQGTANMQGALFNLMYAQSLDDVKEQVAMHPPVNVNSSDYIDSLSGREKDRILNLVIPDEYNFATGAWFMQKVCGQELRDKMSKSLDLDSFTDYMNCIGAPVDPIDERRIAYMERAKKAFGLHD